MGTIVQDIRYSLRLLRSQPGFSLIALLTLAFGIGASTALFSVIDAALLRPLPYAHPEQLVIANIVEQQGGQISVLGPSLTDARDWRANSRVVTAVGVARDSLSRVVVDAGGGPERVTVNDLSEGLLELYGVAPILGRVIRQDDVAVNAPAVVLLGYGYWQTRFGGDPNVVNRTVRFVEGPATIVGVLPAAFYRKASLWRPHQVNATYWAANRRGMGTETYARLAAGVGLQQAERELTALTRRLASERGEAIDISVRLQSLYEDTTSGYTTTVNTLSGAVGFILLIACVNVAGLLLARGATRRPELAIRASVGASRGRLVRQLFTESLVLAVMSGSTGVLIAWMSLGAMVTMIPMSLPNGSLAQIDLHVLGFASALAAVTAVLFGLLPAWRLSHVQLSAAFGGGNRVYGSALSRRGGQFLIGIEVALAVVLLACAGLLARSFARAMTVDLGFDPSAVLTMEVAPLEQTNAVLSGYYPSLLSRIRALPGVAAASAVDFAPLGNGYSMTGAQIPGRPFEMMVIRHALPGYVQTMGLTLTEGRLPSDAELSAGSTLVVINEEAARRLFPNESAVGRTFDILPKQTAQVVAIAGNIRQDGPLYKVQPELSVISTQPITRPLMVVVRPTAGARVSNDQLRQAALGIGPKVFLEGIRVGSDWLSDRVITPRRRMLLFGLLGSCGLAMTLVGIFGTTACAVARRTQEIGVRMAFGARPRQIVQTIVGDAAWPVAIGIVVGLGGAMLSTTLIAKFLFQTTPTDPSTFAAVAIMLATAAVIAAWIPARRAAKVDPVVALRAE